MPRMEETAPPARPKSAIVILLDSLNQPKVSSGALELVDRLIIAAAQGDLVNTCLIVLALPTAVPSSVAVDVEDHRLQALSVTDLQKYIADLAACLGRTLDPTAKSFLEERVLGSLLPPFNHDSMGAIGRRLRELPELLQQQVT